MQESYDRFATADARETRGREESMSESFNPGQTRRQICLARENHLHSIRLILVSIEPWISLKMLIKAQSYVNNLSALD